MTQESAAEPPQLLIGWTQRRWGIIQIVLGSTLLMGVIVLWFAADLAKTDHLRLPLIYGIAGSTAAGGLGAIFVGLGWKRCAMREMAAGYTTAAPLPGLWRLDAKTGRVIGEP